MMKHILIILFHRFKCNFCEKKYKNEYSIKKHVDKNHSICLECFKVFPNFEALILHQHTCQEFLQNWDLEDIETMQDTYHVIEVP